MTRRQKAAATFAGVRAVTAYELRVRHRARGWQWLLALWFALAGGLCATVAVVEYRTGTADEPGTPVFGYTVVLLLALLLLIVPMLARPPDGRFAQGARTAPQLAGLEATELALGELAASWAVVVLLVALTLPALAATTFMGGVSPREVGSAACAMTAVLCCVSALAQWRPGWTYVIVLVLALGTPFLYSAALKVTKYDVAEVDSTGRVLRTHTFSRPHKVWWVLAPNPFVVVGDAGRPGYGHNESPPDPLTDMSEAVRTAHHSPAPVWPQGLLFLGLAGTTVVGVTTAHLRVRQDRSVVR